MSVVSTNLTVSVDNPFESTTFNFEVDPTEIKSLEAVYSPPRTKHILQTRVQPVGRYKLPSLLVRPGKAIIKCYLASSFDSQLSFTSLSPITQLLGKQETFNGWTILIQETPAIQGSFFLNNLFVTFFHSGYDGNNQFKVRGRKGERISEVLRFRNSRIQNISHNYDNPDIEIKEVTKFIDNKGKEVSVPIERGNGFFVSDVEVSGLMQVEYNTTYNEVEVWYDVPNYGVPYEITDNNSLGIKEIFWPGVENPQLIQEYLPLPVIVRFGDNSEFVEIPRKIMNYTFSGPLPDNDDVQADEVERIEEDVRITDPDDADNFIDVKRMTKVKLVDPNGRTFEFKFKA